LTSLKCFTEKKSTNKFLIFLRLSLNSNYSPWNIRIGFDEYSNTVKVERFIKSSTPNSTMSITFSLNILPIMISLGLFFYELPNTKNPALNLLHIFSS